MSIPHTQEPLGKVAPYIIPSHAGESISLPGTKSTVRILASAAETERLISVFHFDGVTGDPAGFHYHNHAHDVFMCTRGRQKLWIGDMCRILNPGDFASVPPKVIHCPQLIDPITETIGLVTPGDWVDFFRFISEKYDGVFAPEFDDRNPMDSIFPKIQTIKEKYDVVFQPHFQGAEVSEWSSRDHIIPDGVSPYYLQSNRGPCYLLGGVLSRPFITTAQNSANFAITSIESSSKLGPSVLARTLSFESVHQVYCVLDGSIDIYVEGQANSVRAGETVFIPKGTKMSIDFTDNYVRFWSYSSGDGLEALIQRAGDRYLGNIVPDEARAVNGDKLTTTARLLGITLSEGRVNVV